MTEDQSPHQSAFITVNGVRLHYLDWGGAGQALLFLPGLGDSAHIFDDIAPEFISHFHVLGLTRRGQGHSEKPKTGYDTATLAEDIHQFLDALHIEQVTLIGHSLAGDEMTCFAGKYPQQVDRLIYLDANYDAADDNALNESLPIPYPSSEQHRQSVEIYARWLQKYMYGDSWSSALAANLHATLNIAADGTFANRMPDDVATALLNGILLRPDYASVQVPVLAFFAIKDHFPGIEDHFPGIEDHDAATQEKVRLWMKEYALPFVHKAAEHLHECLPQAKIVEINAASHYFFIDKQIEVVQEINQFLDAS